MRAVAALILAAAGGALALAAARQSQAALNPAPGEGAADLAASGLELAGQAAESVLGVVDDALFDLTGARVVSGTRWLAAAEAFENLDKVEAARAAEDRYGIPRNLWVRTLWQESRFNPSAFNASSNASGIAQIVPRWHPGVDVWDWAVSIDYGAKYLAAQYRQFGTWELALKAYNWGPGNVKKWLDAGRSTFEPVETQLYSAQILGDLAAAGQGVA